MKQSTQAVQGPIVGGQLSSFLHFGTEHHGFTHLRSTAMTEKAPYSMERSKCLFRLIWLSVFILWKWVPCSGTVHDLYTADDLYGAEKRAVDDRVKNKTGVLYFVRKFMLMYIISGALLEARRLACFNC